MVAKCLLASVILLSYDGLAGTNGILEGVVKDKSTGEFLPGVNVVILELQQGAVSDKDGRYQLQNIRAGAYQVRFSLIGFQSYVVKNVVINPDLRTRLSINMEAADINLEEVVVVQEKPLIQKDITGTTFMITAQEISALPVDVVSEVIRLKPGVTFEGNVRGGKSSEVVYLVDGLPIQDVLSGGIGSNLPTSSVFGASIYTGGFEPEYGNALSGVVNIVTKMGTTDHRFIVRGDKDDLFGGTQHSRSNEFEISASGPVVTDRLYYVGALNGLFTGTRWWQDFDHFFTGPIEKNLSGFGKLDYLFSPGFRVGGQVLYNHRDWHDYQFDWRFNLDGLPPERRTSYRVAAIISHTVSETFFYTASLSRFSLDTRIGTGAKEAVPANDPYQYDFFLRYVIDGQRGWWSKAQQESYTGRFDGTWRGGDAHLVKFGGEVNLYNLTSDLVKYESRKTYFGKPLVNEPQLNFTSSYNYKPRSGSVYVQDKLDLSKDGILINGGLRYDFLDPTAERPNVEAIPTSDSTYEFEYHGSVKAKWKHQLSPRLGAAMQLTENGYLFVNLGWYFQYPLFDYLYTGLDRVALARGLAAFTGNPDLEPERTRAYEISLKWSFEQNVVASITYFKKETKNLVDTKTFVPGDSKVAGTFGFSEYVNTPFAESHGVELVLSRERGEWITGELSYAYMVAEGTSGSAQDGFYIAQFGLPPATRLFALSWDQRHSIKATAAVKLPQEFQVTLFAEWHSGRPYTHYATATGFEPVRGGDFAQNNERMPRYLNVDIKAAKAFVVGWWQDARFTVYVDCRNLANEKNVKWVDSNGRIGGELGDPSGFFIGRRTNVGLQIAF